MIKSIKKFITSLFVDPVYNSPISNSLEGKTIIITGASRGIGKAIAQTLSKEGANLVLISRNLQVLTKAFPKLNSNKTLLLTGDVGNDKDVDKMIRQTTAKFKTIDVLINNAGIFLNNPLELTSSEDFNRIVKTNIKGAFLMSKAVIPSMKKMENGLIINIGSKISHNSNVEANKVMYAMTKYAIEGFSKALNNELRNYGIKVTCLMPATVNTFVSFKSKNYLLPYDIGFVILTIIKCKKINFESIIFRSENQNI